MPTPKKKRSSRSAPRASRKPARAATRKSKSTAAFGSRRAARARKPYRVGQSGIHGHGVFATTTIRRGARLLEYTGEIVGAAEAERRAKRSKHVYIFDLENGTYIDGDPTSDAAHVNHSCEPNCVVEIVKNRVFVVADRTIRPGEELTYDYSFDAETDLWLCACAARRCRGTINVTGERPVVRTSDSARQAWRKK